MATEDEFAEYIQDSSIRYVFCIRQEDAGVIDVSGKRWDFTAERFRGEIPRLHHAVDATACRVMRLCTASLHLFPAKRMGLVPYLGVVNMPPCRPLGTSLRLCVSAWDFASERSAVKSFVASAQFRYYLNPTPLDRNLEWDQKTNLFSPGKIIRNSNDKEP